MASRQVEYYNKKLILRWQNRFSSIQVDGKHSRIYTNECDELQNLF